MQFQHYRAYITGAEGSKCRDRLLVFQETTLPKLAEMRTAYPNIVEDTIRNFCRAFGHAREDCLYMTCLVDPSVGKHHTIAAVPVSHLPH